MKILFLDIDGVLNSGEYIQSLRYKKRSELGFPDCDLDPVAIQHLNRLCRVTGAKIVISSTWREFDDCIPALKRNGLKAPIVGKTPNLQRINRSCSRGEEIDSWEGWKLHKLDNYLILDDDSDMLPKQKDNFIQTNPRQGLTEEITNIAIKKLGQMEQSVKEDLIHVQSLFLKAERNAQEFMKVHFPEGTRFDLGNHRYKVIAHETNEHRKFGLDIKNVKNHSTRPIDLEKEIDNIENIERLEK